MTDYIVNFNNVSLPTNTSGTLTVYEDESGGSTADTSNSVSLTDGKTQYSVSGFDASSGNSVWIEVSVDNSDVTTTGSVFQSVTVESAVTKPSSPQNVDASYVADDQIDNSFDDPSDWGGETGSFDVEILRDNGTWEDTSGGPSNPSTSGTYSYGPNSDTAYGRQVGIDSSFQFRVRATNSAGASDWSYSDTVYTTPVPPHNPSVSRPDANTVEIKWTRQSDSTDSTVVEIREDTGSGYGSWDWFDSPGNPPNKGDTKTATYEVGTSYSGTFGAMQEDARYQFRIREHRVGGANGEFVYCDYGNSGNVYFEDDFEDQDLAEWDNTTLNDADSGIQSGEVTDLGIDGADEGTYYLRLDGGDSAYKQLGDLSNESDVIVKATVATGSMDTASEESRIEWYDGSSWHNLRTFGHEYNKQGWVEVTALVPSSYLSTDNFVRFRGYGSSVDLFAVDRVVVSDILHEYTKPAAPSNLELDNSVSGELAATWTSNTNLPNTNSHFQEFRRRITNSGNDLFKTNIEEQTTYTITGIRDGEKYDIRVDSLYQQFRNGSTDKWWRNSSSLKSIISYLPAITNLTSPSHMPSSFDLSWTANHNYGDTRIEYKPTSASTWQTVSTVNRSTETATVSGLENGEKYDVRVIATTEHTETVDT